MSFANRQLSFAFTTSPDAARDGQSVQPVILVIEIGCSIRLRASRRNPVGRPLKQNQPERLSQLSQLFVHDAFHSDRVQSRRGLPVTLRAARIRRNLHSGREGTTKCRTLSFIKIKHIAKTPAPEDRRRSAADLAEGHASVSSRILYESRTQRRCG